MTKIWTYISTFLAGVVAGLLLFLRLKDPEVVVNDNQRIGKVKQRGEGAVQSTELREKDIKDTRDEKDTKEPTERQARRAARRLERREIREKRKETG